MSVPVMLFPIDQLSSCMSLCAPLRVALRDDAAVVHHDERRGEPLGVREGASTACRSLAVSIPAGSGVVGKDVAHRPGRRGCVGQRVVTGTGLKKTVSARAGG